MKICHAGAQTLICHLREKFWILSMRKTVRSVDSKCIVCKKFGAKKMKAGPAPLPVHRVKDAAVFEVIELVLLDQCFYAHNKRVGSACSLARFIEPFTWNL